MFQKKRIKKFEISRRTGKVLSRKNREELNETVKREWNEKLLPRKEWRNRDRITIPVNRFREYSGSNLMQVGILNYAV